MHFSTLKPFVPSGSDYKKSKSLFLELGFAVNWEVEGLCELQCGDAIFLLQDFENLEMQQNYMLYVTVDDLDAFHDHLISLNLPERYEGVKFSPPEDRPWGERELHFLDLAGVCWHFS